MATSKPRLDRRIVRSRNAILSAFERLLMEKPLADITVSAIAREANVDRKTFYVHFGTVDGLLDAIAVDVVEMIVDSVEKTLASMDGDTNERAFEPIRDKTIARAKELLVHCARLIVCPAAFGTINARNAELVEFARSHGIEVMQACEGASEDSHLEWEG